MAQDPHSERDTQPLPLLSTGPLNIYSAPHRTYEFGGHTYFSKPEVQVAQLLHNNGVAATPHLKFVCMAPGTTLSREKEVDFIFTKPQKLLGITPVIGGLEVKGPIQKKGIITRDLLEMCHHIRVYTALPSLIGLWRRVGLFRSPQRAVQDPASRHTPVGMVKRLERLYNAHHLSYRRNVSFDLIRRNPLSTYPFSFEFVFEKPQKFAGISPIVQALLVRDYLTLEDIDAVESLEFTHDIKAYIVTPEWVEFWEADGLFWEHDFVGLNG